MTEQQEQTAIQKPGQVTALSRVNVSERGVRISSLDDLWRFSAMVFDSGLAPSGMKNVQAIAIAVEFGMELGIPPMQSVQTICVINNRPLIYGTGFLGVCKSDPKWDEDRFEEWFTGSINEKNLTAHCRMARKGSTNVTETEYSMADAITAELWGKKDNWKKNPTRMLKWRARTWCGRDTFPERLAGLYTAEEAQELIDVEVSDARPTIRQPSRLPAAQVEERQPFSIPPDAMPADEPTDAPTPSEADEHGHPEPEATGGARNIDGAHRELAVKVFAALKADTSGRYIDLRHTYGIKAPIKLEVIAELSESDLQALNSQL